MPVIGKRTAKAILDVLDNVREFHQSGCRTVFMDGSGRELTPVFTIEPLYAEVSKALEPKRGAKKRRTERIMKQIERSLIVSELRHQLFVRSKGHCENCGAMVTEQSGDPDHFFGGASKHEWEFVEAMWFLCRKCHRRKTDNEPDRKAWLIAFQNHIRRKMLEVDGYANIRYGPVLVEATKRLGKLETA